MGYSDFLHQRLKDLDENITADLSLLHEFNKALRYETNPRRIAKYQQDIERQKKSIKGYYQEFIKLQRQANNELSLNHSSSRSLLKNLEGRFDQIEGILDDILKSQNDLLERYDVGEKVIIGTIIKKLNQIEIRVTQTFLNAIDSHQLLDSEMQEMLGGIEKHLPVLSSYNISAIEESNITEIIQAPELDFRHRLKVAIPIIPFLVDYETELELGSGFNIRSAWQKLVTKLNKK